MKKLTKAVSVVTALATVVTAGSMAVMAEGGEDKTTITFWHSWSGSEADALQAVVDDYNGSQNEIYVEVLSSQTEDKMLTAIPSGAGYNVQQMGTGGHAERN